MSQFTFRGLGFRVWGSGLRGLGFGVQGLGFRVWGLGLRVKGLGLGSRVQICRIWGLGCRRDFLLDPLQDPTNGKPANMNPVLHWGS